jgi:hypothetical protein
MLDHASKIEFYDAPVSVPFSNLDRDMAMEVHNQTLERLASRGGLDPSEMLSLMEGLNIFSGSVGGVRLMGMPKRFAIDAIKDRLK